LKVGVKVVDTRNNPEWLENGYREMASDEEREAEAAEWSDGLIADVAHEPADQAMIRSGRV
jgi:hypothetical protein